MRIIAGTAGSRRIEAPRGQVTRPTLDRVRENLFNMLQNDIEGAYVLDLFAGSGALGLEALSRGASSAVFADINPDAIRTVERNLHSLGFEERSRVMPGDWKHVLGTLGNNGDSFDLVFLDPPYAMKDRAMLMKDVLALLKPDADVIFEHEAKDAAEVYGGYDLRRQRNWGYCGVSIYRKRECE